MRICIDSNQFIFGISGTDAACERLLFLLPRLEVVLPRIVITEVTRNLSPAEVKTFHTLLRKSSNTTVIYEAVPRSLVDKYVALGLREKGDAFIGAFAEWQQVTYLISDNRHFLVELKTTAFEIVTPERFLQSYIPSTYS
ncbi:MAG: hypothetical protein DYG89_01015 [Caldilinea sp. CFX5]|nr:hypothetical protein [Caldilinea sp. CFX5]